MNANRYELIEQLRTNVPQELRHLVQWVVWRMEDRNGKPTKVPYNPKTGDRAISSGLPDLQYKQLCRTGIRFLAT